MTSTSQGLVLYSFYDSLNLSIRWAGQNCSVYSSQLNCSGMKTGWGPIECTPSWGPENFRIFPPIDWFSVTSRTMTTSSTGCKQKTRPEEMYVVMHLWCRRRRKKKVKVLTQGCGGGPVSLPTVITSAKPLGDVLSGSAQRRGAFWCSLPSLLFDYSLWVLRTACTVVVRKDVRQMISPDNKIVICKTYARWSHQILK